MAVTQKGVGVVWGVGNLTFTGITIETAGKIQSYDFTRDSEVNALKDTEGETVGEQYFDRKRTLNLQVVPSSTTIALAKAALVTLLPEPGTVVTLADTDAVGTPLESVTDNTTGKYVVVSAKVGRSNTGFATVDMALKSFDARDVATTIT